MILLAKIARRDSWRCNHFIHQNLYTDIILACHDNVSFSSLGAQLQSEAEPLSFVTPRDESDRIPGWKK